MITNERIPIFLKVVDVLVK